MPLALDAGTVRVEGLPYADGVQSSLIGQFGQQLGDLIGRLVGE